MLSLRATNPNPQGHFAGPRCWRDLGLRSAAEVPWSAHPASNSIPAIWAMRQPLLGTRGRPTKSGIQDDSVRITLKSGFFRSVSIFGLSTSESNLTHHFKLTPRRTADKEADWRTKRQTLAPSNISAGCPTTETHRPVPPSSKRVYAQRGTSLPADPSWVGHRSAAVGRRDHRSPGPLHHPPRWSSWSWEDPLPASRHASDPARIFTPDVQGTSARWGAQSKELLPGSILPWDIIRHPSSIHHPSSSSSSSSSLVSSSSPPPSWWSHPSKASVTPDLYNSPPAEAPTNLLLPELPLPRVLVSNQLAWPQRLRGGW